MGSEVVHARPQEQIKRASRNWQLANEDPADVEQMQEDAGEDADEADVMAETIHSAVWRTEGDPLSMLKGKPCRDVVEVSPCALWCLVLRPRAPASSKLSSVEPN